MYYVTTETDKHKITTSYVSEKQARRYGGEPVEKQMGLVMEELWDSTVTDYEEVFGDISLVRTVYESKHSTIPDLVFALYVKGDSEYWTDTGIWFSSMSDANQAVKGPLAGTFADMVIVEQNYVKPVFKQKIALIGSSDIYD